MTDITKTLFLKSDYLYKINQLFLFLEDLKLLNIGKNTFLINTAPSNVASGRQQ